ncbi:hypothetical protein GGD46_001314 [Rhizobium lusitanum]|uniref:Uncharacterized protein n=1 Tax=Rhizobium lusitanum TaxID=293958 RepID=A0A7X0IP04_9HYPH|nr:hypothetical protein [Rhizobium lusitanum]
MHVSEKIDILESIVRHLPNWLRRLSGSRQRLQLFEHIRIPGETGIGSRRLRVFRGGHRMSECGVGKSRSRHGRFIMMWSRRLGRNVTNRRVDLSPNLLYLIYDVIDRRYRNLRRRSCVGRFDGNRLYFFCMVPGFFMIGRSLFMMDRLVDRFFGNSDMMLGSGRLLGCSMMHFLIRLAPFLRTRMFMRSVWLGISSRLFMDEFFMNRLRSAWLLMVNFGGNRFLLVRFGLLMSLHFGVMLLGGFGRDLMMHDRCCGDRLFCRRHRLGMFGLDLDDRGLKLVELTAEHFLGRARLHTLKLPLNGTTSPIVNLDPHLGSIVRQAVNGPSNDCYKIRHQHFLMMPGERPGRDSS